MLVSYLEKNKRIKIPTEKAENDLEYLQKEVIVQFKFELSWTLHFRDLISTGTSL